MFFWWFYYYSIFEKGLQPIKKIKSALCEQNIIQKAGGRLLTRITLGRYLNRNCILAIDESYWCVFSTNSACRSLIKSYKKTIKVNKLLYCIFWRPLYSVWEKDVMLAYLLLKAKSFSMSPVLLNQTNRISHALDFLSKILILNQTNRIDFFIQLP